MEDTESVLELKELDALLKCGICYEHMQTPVITSCSHTFCSFCIRKSLSYKQLCPTCSTDVHENSLRKNNTVEDIIALFDGLKKNIFMLLKNGTTSLKDHDVKRMVPESPQAVQIPRSSQMTTPISRREQHAVIPTTTPPSNFQEQRKTTPGSGKKAVEKFLPVIDDSDGSDSDFIPRKQNTPTPARRKATVSTKSPRGGPSVVKVPCPVCSVNMPEREMNAHLDICLTGGRDTRNNSSSTASSDTPSSSSSVKVGVSDKSKRAKPSEKDLAVPRQPLRKMVYNLMSDAQLKKELKVHGVSAQGDRHALQKRLQRFVVLHNAECDARNPRSIHEIKLLLEKEEKALSMPVATTSLTQMLKSVKNPAENHIEEARRDYIQKNKSSYELLIQQIKERENTKKKRKVNCIESDSDSPDTASDIQPSCHKRRSIDSHSFKTCNNTSPKINEDVDSKATSPVNRYSSTSPICLIDLEGEPRRSDTDEESPVRSAKRAILNQQTSRPRRQRRAATEDVDSKATSHFNNYSGPSPVQLTDVKEVSVVSDTDDESTITHNQEVVRFPVLPASLNQLTGKPRRQRKAATDVKPRERKPQRPRARNGGGARRTRAQCKSPTPSEQMSVRSYSSTPDMFQGTPSSSGSEIPPGQRCLQAESDNEDNLSQLISVMDNGSSTDFEDS